MVETTQEHSTSPQLWIKVRTVGQLTILWKASYFTLLFVPMLAGLWPAVRITVNQYNRTAIHASETFNNTINALRAETNRLEDFLRDKQIPEAPNTRGNHLLDNLVMTVQKFENDLEKLISDIKPMTLDSPLLPWSWSASFFAALCIALGHLTYEAKAPLDIRIQSEREFIRSNAKEYLESESEGRVQNAQDILKKANLSYKITDYPGTGIFQKAALIEESAREEYRSMASSEYWSAVISLFLYVCGILLVMIVIAKQAYVVSRGAGWL